MLYTVTKLPRAAQCFPSLQKGVTAFFFYLPNAFLSPLLIPLQKEKKKQKSRLKNSSTPIALYPLILRRAECSFLFVHTAHESSPSPAVSPASPERIWRQHQQRGKHRPQRRNSPAHTEPKAPPRHPSCVLIG